MKLFQKILLGTVLLIIILLVSLFIYITSQQSSDISLSIYRNSLSFSETVKKDIYNNFLRFYESGVLKFKGLMDDTIKLNTDIKNIQIYGFNGNLLYDHIVDQSQSNVYKRYKENPIKSDDPNLIEAIKSVETIIYFIGPIDGNKNTLPVHHVKNNDLLNNRAKYIIVPILDENTRHEYSILYEITYQELDKKIESMLINMGILFLVFIVMSIIGSIFVSKSVTKNLNLITQQISKIAKDARFEEKITIKSKDEVGILANTFNDMAQKIEESQKKEIENQKFQKEAEILADIQNSILPQTLPDIPKLEISAYYKPASKAGGDIYDIIDLEGKYFLYIADVSGHGSGPSIVAAIANNLFYAYTQLNMSLFDTTMHMHNIIKNKMKLKNRLYLTAFFSIWNHETNTLRYISAGHLPTLIYKSSTKEVIELHKGGFPIGMISYTDIVIKKNIDKDPDFMQEHEIKLDTNDYMIFYTDGITEAKNSQEDDFGLEPFKSSIKKYCDNNPNISTNELIENLLIDIKEHTQDYEQKDDITFVTIKVK